MVQMATEKIENQTINEDGRVDSDDDDLKFYLFYILPN